MCRSQVSRPSNRTGSPQTNRFWCIITVGNSFFCSAAVCTRDSKQGQTTRLLKSSACNKNTRITTIYKNSFCLQVQTPMSTKPGTCQIEIRYQSPYKKKGWTVLSAGLRWTRAVLTVCPHVCTMDSRRTNWIPQQLSRPSNPYTRTKF